MKKRVLAAFISLCMIVSLLPVMAFGQGEDNIAASPAQDGRAAEMVCTCASLCSEGAAEETCPVCGAQGADPAPAAPPHRQHRRFWRPKFMWAAWS